MFSVAVWLERGPSFWSDAKKSLASVVLGSCWGWKNVSMTLKIWQFVIWTAEWKLSRWYSLWSSNYATPSLTWIPTTITPQNPNPLLLFLSRNEAVKLLCPLWIIFRVGVMALCPAALHLLRFPSSLHRGCIVFCLVCMLTWGANIQGLQAQLQHLHTTQREGVMHCAVGQHLLGQIIQLGILHIQLGRDK